jgi:hypothetical protein
MRHCVYHYVSNPVSHIMSDGKCMPGGGYWRSYCFKCNKRGNYQKKKRNICFDCRHEHIKSKSEYYLIDCKDCKKKKYRYKKDYCLGCYMKEYNNNEKIVDICIFCKKAGFVNMNKYCKECHNEEYSRRLHNSIIVVAHLYLRNEIWLNEWNNINCENCSIIFTKQNSNDSLSCDDCNKLINDLQTYSVSEDKIYKNLYIKIKFSYENKRQQFYTFQKYPLLKLFTQKDINSNNEIENLDTIPLKYYKLHDQFADQNAKSKIISAVVKREKSSIQLSE